MVSWSAKSSVGSFGLRTAPNCYGKLSCALNIPWGDGFATLETLILTFRHAANIVSLTLIASETYHHPRNATRTSTTHMTFVYYRYPGTVVTQRHSHFPWPSRRSLPYSSPITDFHMTYPPRRKQESQFFSTEYNFKGTRNASSKPSQITIKPFQTQQHNHVRSRRPQHGNGRIRPRGP